jgi:hypothetical protein
MIYVDATQEYPKEMVAKGAGYAGTKWCHMWSSTNDETELLTFAARIKLQPQWIQRLPGFTHFDLTPSRRRAAILQGAIEKPLRDWLIENKGVPRVCRACDCDIDRDGGCGCNPPDS